MKRLLVLIAFSIVFYGQLYAQDKKITAEEYIQSYKDLAVSEMKRTGIPASITLAQGLLESGNGNSRLAKEANNHFGIKCKSGWTGRSINIDDDKPQECFRAYDKAEDSYKDHSDFLTGQQRYAFLFKLDPTDYKGWAYGLKQAGYATNPNYPDMIIQTIEKYALYQYDAGNMKVPPEQMADHTKKPKRSIFDRPIEEKPTLVYNHIPAYVIKPGDTYESIADAYDMMRWEIRKYNDLKRNEPLVPGTLIYLKPKKRKAANDYYTVKDGEGMYDVAQYSGIKLRLLYKWNRMKEGQEPETGEKLNLRHKRAEPPRLKPQGTVMPRKGIRFKQEENPEPPQPNEPGNGGVPPKKEKDSIPAKKMQLQNDTARVGYDSLGRYYIASSDETLYSISIKFNVSFRDLMAWNKISGPLTDGQKIYLVKPKTPTTTSEQTDSPDPLLNKTAPDSYLVQKGETLYGISRKFKIPVDSIISFNHLSSNSLNEGQVLRLKSGKGLTNVKKTDTPVWHTVASGETLYSIARMYKMTVEEIVKLNNMADNSIYIGQRLKIRE